MLVAAGGARQIAQACALLSERHLMPARTASTSSDLLSAIDDWHAVPPHVQRVADQIARSADFKREHADWGEADFRRAILAGYPDRVAERRNAGSANVRLASGAGATIAPESGVRDGEFIVALDVSMNVARGGQPGDQRRQPRHVVHRAAQAVAPELARIRIASRIERAWLQPTGSDVVHRFDNESGTVRAFLVDRYDALTLAERPAPVDPEIAATMLADAWLARGPRPADARLLRRLRFAGKDVDLDSLVRTATHGVGSLHQVRIDRAVAADISRDSRSRRARIARCPQRPPRGTGIQRGRHRLRIGETAGALRPGRDAARRTPA